MTEPVVIVSEPTSVVVEASDSAVDVLAPGTQGLSTDATLRELTAAVEALHASLDSDSRMFPARALQYARTVEDVMRVHVHNQPTATVVANNRGDVDYAGGSFYAAGFTRGAWNITDARYELGESHVQTWLMGARTRWVIT